MTLMVTGALFLGGAILFNHNLTLLLCSAACVSGLGMTICYTALSVISVQGIPSQHYGLASSLATTSYFLGGGIGLSVLSLFITHADHGDAIGSLPVGVLCIYAVAGLCWLITYLSKGVKTDVART